VCCFVMLRSVPYSVTKREIKTACRLNFRNSTLYFEDSTCSRSMYKHVSYARFCPPAVSYSGPNSEYSKDRKLTPYFASVLV
jgi:hypothetical protein